MAASTKAAIHSRILTSIGNEVEDESPIEAIPFILSLRKLGKLAFYAFTLTSPPGGRPTGEYKVQLIVPHQKRDERGQLSFPSGAFTIIAGWSQDEDIFVLWDAYAHETFSFSQNLQVRGESVWIARVNGISTCERHLRDGRGTEVVVVCRPDHMEEAIRSRIHFSASRISYEREQS